MMFIFILQEEREAYEKIESGRKKRKAKIEINDVSSENTTEIQNENASIESEIETTKNYNNETENIREDL